MLLRCLHTRPSFCTFYQLHDVILDRNKTEQMTRFRDLSYLLLVVGGGKSAHMFTNLITSRVPVRFDLSHHRGSLSERPQMKNIGERMEYSWMFSQVLTDASKTIHTETEESLR